MFSERVVNVKNFMRNVQKSKREVTNGIVIQGKDLVSFLTILKEDGVVNNPFVLDDPIYVYGPNYGDYENTETLEYEFYEQDLEISVLEFMFAFANVDVKRFVYDTVLTELYNQLKAMENVNNFGLYQIQVIPRLYTRIGWEDDTFFGDINSSVIFLDEPYFDVKYQVYMD